MARRPKPGCGECQNNDLKCDNRDQDRFTIFPCKLQQSQIAKDGQANQKRDADKIGIVALINLHEPAPAAADAYAVQIVGS